MIFCAAAVLILFCNIVILRLSFVLWLSWKCFANSLLFGLFLMSTLCLEKHSESFSSVWSIYKTLSLKHCAAWIISVSLQFPVSFIFSVVFNLSLVMIFAVVICRQSMHFQQNDTFFYLVFLSRTLTIHRTVGEEEGYFFNSSLQLPLTSQTLITQAITAESSPLHMASSPIRTGDLWFPSASCQPRTYVPLEWHCWSCFIKG